MLGLVDKIVIGIYFIILIGITITSFRRSKDLSDFFRASGSVNWWTAAVSAVVAGFTAMSFTGTAGKVFIEGPVVFIGLVLCSFSIPLLYWFAPRIRRLNKITSVEIVALRHGKFTELVVSWIFIGIAIWYAGFGLVTISTFLSAATSLNIYLLFFLIWGVVMFVILSGGAWAALKTDVFQGVIIFVVMLVLFFKVLQDAGLTTIQNYFSATISMDSIGSVSSSVATIFIFVMVLQASIMQFDVVLSGSRFLFVRNETHAKKMVSLMWVLWFLQPILILLPVVISTQLFQPEEILNNVSHLSHPEEGIVVALVQHYLPTGFQGLFVCALISAAMTSLDTGINKGAGVFTVNILKLTSTNQNKTGLRSARVVSLTMGILILVLGLLVLSYRELGLFDIGILVFSAINGPLALTMALSYFYTKTPAWSGWASICSGLLTAILIKTYFKTELVVWNLGFNLSPVQLSYVSWAIMTVSVIIAVTLTFFISSLLYRYSSMAHKKMVASFRKTLK